MKPNILLIALMLLTAVLSAGQVRQRASGQTQGSYPTVLSGDAKATGGVINSSAKIVIQSGAYLVISGAGNYTSEGTGSVPETGTINLTGNFVNNNSSGAPVAPGSVLHFNGTALQSISGNPVTFGNVSFINPAGVNIGCDTDIAGDLTIDINAGTIGMTDYDFGVSGDVSGVPVIVVTGSGAVGDVGENANVTVDSPQPSGLPGIMNTLEVNPGAAQTYMLPNSTSVANLTFTSGNLAFGSSFLLLRNTDLALSGANTLSALEADMSHMPGTFGANSSINKTWNITGQSYGNVTITLRWQNSENNGNDFSSGFANVFAHNGIAWQIVGRYAISVDSSYNLVSFIRSLGTKDGVDDYTITGDDQTLPVELSSFTAIPTAAMKIILNWTTQSETGMSGYYVYRNINNELDSAQNLNQLISATNSSSEHTYSFTDNEISEEGTYYYWLQSVELNGLVNFYGPVSATLGHQTPDTPIIPTETKLIGIYPNPFNPDTYISFSLKKPETVTASIYNCRGQLIKHYCNKYGSAGDYRINWNGKNSQNQTISSGTYFLIFKAGSYSSSKALVLLK